MALKGAVMLIVVAIVVQRYFPGCDGQFNLVPVPGSFLVPVPGQNFLPAPGQNIQFMSPATTSNQRMLTFVNNILFIKLLQRLVNRQSQSQSDGEEDEPEEEEEVEEVEEEEEIDVEVPPPPNPTVSWWAASIGEGSGCRYLILHEAADWATKSGAKAKCSEFQARLPIMIRDSGTRGEIISHFPGPADPQWVGLKKETDGKWYWGDGVEEMLNSGRWFSDEPELHDACGGLAHSFGGLLVGLSYCESELTDKARPFMCEYCPNQ